MNPHFVLLYEGEVAELSSIARLYTHKKTGAEVLTFSNNDENKVFGVSFRTPPVNSTGVAHILEHSVLCGSEKYPVKEPFVELLKGSLQTFLNAFTYPDKTCYPVASANLIDFRNLTDVYLDAVFFPIISKNIFLQEGWHLTTDEATGSFAFKGVVYNEMKGAFSSPESVLSRHCLRTLFPDNAYGRESGGDPKNIPDLTYEKFCEFHSTLYHPSNAKFFFWGDDDESGRLEQLAPVLESFDPIDAGSIIMKQVKLPVHRAFSIPYAATEDDKNLVAVNWLGPDVMDIETGLAFEILEHILLGLPASPLRRALIESGLGEDLTGGGLESELRQLSFDIGLKGVAPSDIGKVEEVIFVTLEKLVQEGIPQANIEAAVNSVEFQLREKNTGRFPVGLSVMLQSLTTWLHGGNPLSPLQFEAPLSSIKVKIAEKTKLFEELIQEWFIENTHRVTVTLYPDTQLAKKMETEERQRISAKVEALTDDDRQELKAQAKQLAVWQATPDTPEALATIPRLGKKDLPTKNAFIPSDWSKTSIPLMFHGLATGGVGYVEAAFSLEKVANNNLPLVPLLGRALLEMGTNKRDFVELNMEIAKKTGGMSADCLFLQPLQSKAPSAHIVLSAKTTPDKVENLFSLFSEVVNEVSLDQKERFLRMVLEEKARHEHGLVPSGHMTVATRLQAGFDAASVMSEATGGIEYIFFLRNLLYDIEKDWQGVLTRLEALRYSLFVSSGLIANVTALPEQEREITALVQEFAASLCVSGKGTVAKRNLRVLPDAEALLLPAQVNYTGKGINLYQSGYSWHGSARVILKYLRTGYLWDNIRVRGGAYGCMCGLSRSSGGFYMVSYRDPNVMASLAVYDAVAEYLEKNTPSKQILESAIVGAIGELDTYLLPDAKGRVAFSRYLSGETEESLQQMRDEILSTTNNHFKKFGEALTELKSKGKVCVLGGNALEEVAKKQGWENIKVL